MDEIPPKLLMETVQQIKIPLEKYPTCHKEKSILKCFETSLRPKARSTLYHTTTAPRLGISTLNADFLISVIAVTNTNARVIPSGLSDRKCINRVFLRSTAMTLLVGVSFMSDRAARSHFIPEHPQGGATV